MIYGEPAFNSIEAELANLLADVQVWLTANGFETAEMPAPNVPSAADPVAPTDPLTPPEPAASETPAAEATSADAPSTEIVADSPAPTDDFAFPDFAGDVGVLTVGQSLAGADFVFIF
jgi:hypothetical protein